ncbi:hypothetical protein C8R45DRAFT_788752, partial [Mycena sanguinolenta]
PVEARISGSAPCTMSALLRLVELDAQIIEQRRVLCELQETRTNVESELHATATFPVLTIPTELTAEIFLRCFQLLQPLRIPDFETSTPIVLSGVCRAWRDIALATPPNWKFN